MDRQRLFSSPSQPQSSCHRLRAIPPHTPLCHVHRETQLFIRLLCTVLRHGDSIGSAVTSPLQVEVTHYSRCTFVTYWTAVCAYGLAVVCVCGRNFCVRVWQRPSWFSLCVCVLFFDFVVSRHRYHLSCAENSARRRGDWISECIQPCSTSNPILFHSSSPLLFIWLPNFFAVPKAEPFDMNIHFHIKTLKTDSKILISIQITISRSISTGTGITGTGITRVHSVKL